MQIFLMSFITELKDELEELLGVSDLSRKELEPEIKGPRNQSI